jgi:copper resistance protein D
LDIAVKRRFLIANLTGPSAWPASAQASKENARGGPNGACTMAWEFIVHWLHTFCAIFWFGGIMYVNAVIGPAMLRCGPVVQAEAGDRLARQAVRVTRPMALMTILFGIVLGSVFGPVKHVSDLFGSAYGTYYLLALVLSIAVYLWGQLLTARTALSVAATPEPGRTAVVRRVIMLSGIELIGFLAIFTCMVLMHFAAEHDAALFAAVDTPL